MADLVAHRHIAVRFLGQRTAAWNLRGGDGAEQAFVPPRPLLTVSAPQAATSAAVRGMGIAQVGLNHAWQYLQSGALKVLMPESHNSSALEIALHYPHRALVAPRIRATVEFLLQRLRTLPSLTATPADLGPYVTHPWPRA
jgi:DNA-binding transcriptional LysR family regulator